MRPKAIVSRLLLAASLALGIACATAPDPGEQISVQLVELVPDPMTGKLTGIGWAEFDTLPPRAKSAAAALGYEPGDRVRVEVPDGGGPRFLPPRKSDRR